MKTALLHFEYSIFWPSFLIVVGLFCNVWRHSPQAAWRHGRLRVSVDTWVHMGHSNKSDIEATLSVKNEGKRLAASRIHCIANCLQPCWSLFINLNTTYIIIIINVRRKLIVFFWMLGLSGEPVPWILHQLMCSKIYFYCKTWKNPVNIIIPICIYKHRTDITSWRNFP